MTLIPCPECERAISSRALACPHCGYPLAPTGRELVARAWREGFSHAWKAAAAFAAILAFTNLAHGSLSPESLLHMLPWAVIAASWGFGAGLVAVAVAALLRMRFGRSATKPDIWRWSNQAVAVVVVLYTLFIVLVIEAG